MPENIVNRGVVPRFPLVAFDESLFEQVSARPVEQVEEINARSRAGQPLRIDWDKARCTHCMSCMVVCSERHVGVSAPSRAHLRIAVDLLKGDYALGARDAEYCRQCQAAPCVAACPSEAFWLDEQVRAWRVDPGLCLACGACVEVCPIMRFDSIR